MGIQPDFDPARLESFLGAPVSLEPVSGGQSNPTWFLTVDGRELVLRKKPRGTTAASAHAIDREYRVMSALEDSGVPVPRMVRMESDPEIIGTPFYLMERLRGEVWENTALPGLDPAARAAIHTDAARVLARLHAAEWQALGLADFGRVNGFYERQVRRWCGQWEALERDDPRIDALAAWFAGNIPPEN